MLTVADCGTVIHPQGLAHQLRGGNVMGIGLARLERHVYDPKLGLPAAALLYQAKPPSYLDVPAEIRWGAVDKADPQNPVGVKGGRRAAARLRRGGDYDRGLGCAGRPPVQPDAGINRHDRQSPVRAAAIAQAASDQLGLREHRHDRQGHDARFRALSADAAQ
jgi:hypothetical protein